MSDIQFQSDQADEFATRPSATSAQSLGDKLITWGIAKNAKQAGYIMVGFAIAVLVLAYVVYSMMTSSPAPAPEPLE